MRRCALFLLAAFAWILGFTAADTGAGTEKKGVVTYAEGQVKKKPSVSPAWQNAPVNTEVVSGDMVRTYPQSQAELNLLQLDVIRLAPKTTIDIVKLYQETKEKRVKTEIKLQQGQLWAAVHEVTAQTDFDIAAPVAAAAITGTILQMRVDSDTTTQLKVYKGEVHITNAPERTDLQPRSLKPTQVPGPHPIPGPHQVGVEEWMYIVKAMQQVTISKKGAIVSMGDFSNADPDEKSDWVKWNKKRDIEWIRGLRKNR